MSTAVSLLSNHDDSRPKNSGQLIENNGFMVFDNCCGGDSFDGTQINRSNLPLNGGDVMHQSERKWPSRGQEQGLTKRRACRGRFIYTYRRA